MSSSSHCSALARAGAILLAALLCLPAQAGWRDDLPGAALAGEGAFRWLGLRLYTAQLWRGALPLAESGQWPLSTPFALQLRYDYAISRERFVDTSLAEIRRMDGERRPEATLAQWQAELNRAFVDVAAGEQLIGVYLPGRGARFYHGERLTAELSDPQLAEAFFAIWLGPKARDSRLRAQLLGRAP
ncbi:chalcone isomerase family protein [Chitinimonas sp.]|uniref:chalcone isomerase family protein n=1 Tax=Chitinimonas sp. TaxID=1934313 RepID=UPI0035B0E6E5